MSEEEAIMSIPSMRLRLWWCASEKELWASPCDCLQPFNAARCGWVDVDEAP